MKYIEKQIEDNRTGASANHHVVTGLNVDYVNNSTIITISSYVSKDKKETGNDVFSTKGAYWFVVTVVGIFSVKSKRFFGGIDYIHDWIY